MNDHDSPNTTTSLTDQTRPSALGGEPKPKQRRGFAVMDPRQVAEIASKGGRAAHAAGTAHEFSSDEARAAGRKGGLAPHQPRRSSAPKNPT